MWLAECYVLLCFLLNLRALIGQPEQVLPITPVLCSQFRLVYDCSVYICDTSFSLNLLVSDLHEAVADKDFLVMFSTSECYFVSRHYFLLKA